MQPNPDHRVMLQRDGHTQFEQACGSMALSLQDMAARAQEIGASFRHLNETLNKQHLALTDRLPPAAAA